MICESAHGMRCGVWRERGSAGIFLRETFLDLDFWLIVTKTINVTNVVCGWNPNRWILIVSMLIVTYLNLYVVNKYIMCVTMDSYWPQLYNTTNHIRDIQRVFNSTSIQFVLQKSSRHSRIIMCEKINSIRGPFLPTWINGATVEIWESISNFNSHFILDVMSYLCLD